MAPDVTEADAVARALAAPGVAALLEGREPSRVVARAPRLVNVIP